MCGICGVLGQLDAETVTRMTRSMAHRGPDGEGFYFGENIALGVRRLQITGPLENNQPIWNEDKTACIIFNGEIYNFRELQSLLESKGHSLRSASDSEVVLHLYEDYGKDCVQYLKGMFAFAIWDGAHLFLARDRMGIKPLFYSRLSNPEELIFGSEMKAITRHPEVRDKTDQRALSELNVLGFILSPERTLNAMIKQVRPGSTITFSYKNGSISEQDNVYFKLDPMIAIERSSDCFDVEKAVDQLEGVLRKSCRAIMNQDSLPKGIYLSGGLDSSLLAVICSEESSIPLHTFTLADSPDSDDLKYARQVAKSIGSTHHEVLVEADEYLAEYPDFLQAYESIPMEGTFDMNGDFAFFLLSKHIAKHVKVAICGEGADELFGGYWMHRWPLGYADRLWERLAKLEDVEEKNELERRLRCWFPEEEDKETYRCGVFDLLLGSGLSNYHLWAVDRASMRYGLEVRVPYLHDNVVSLVRRLPLNSLVREDETKHFLRKLGERILRRYSLDKILIRPKRAMPDAIKRIANLSVKTQEFFQSAKG